MSHEAAVKFLRDNGYGPAADALEAMMSMVDDGSPEYCEHCKRWYPPWKIEHQPWFNPCRRCDCEEHAWIEWNGLQESIVAIHDEQVNNCSGPLRFVRHREMPAADAFERAKTAEQERDEEHGKFVQMYNKRNRLRDQLERRDAQLRRMARRYKEAVANLDRAREMNRDNAVAHAVAHAERMVEHSAALVVLSEMTARAKHSAHRIRELEGMLDAVNDEKRRLRETADSLCEERDAAIRNAREAPGEEILVHDAPVSSPEGFPK